MHCLTELTYDEANSHGWHCTRAVMTNLVPCDGHPDFSDGDELSELGLILSNRKESATWNFSKHFRHAQISKGCSHL
jgi:hypothetical protein